MHTDSTDPKDSIERQLDPSPDEASSQDPPAICSDDVISWPLQGGGVTQISPGDVDAVAEHVWRAVKIAGRSYAVTSMEHRRVYLHRLIHGDFRYWDEGKCKWRATQVDHIDNNGLNNARQNLHASPEPTEREGKIYDPALPI